MPDFGVPWSYSTEKIGSKSLRQVFKDGRPTFNVCTDGKRFSGQVLLRDHGQQRYLDWNQCHGLNGCVLSGGCSGYRHGTEVRGEEMVFDRPARWRKTWKTMQREVLHYEIKN